MRRGTRRTSGRVEVHPTSPKYHHRLPVKQQTNTPLEFRHKHARTCARSGADIHTHSLQSHVHTSTPHAQHDRSSRSELLITSSLLSGVSTFSVLFSRNTLKRQRHTTPLAHSWKHTGLEFAQNRSYPNERRSPTRPNLFLSLSSSRTAVDRSSDEEFRFRPSAGR